LKAIAIIVWVGTSIFILERVDVFGRTRARIIRIEDSVVIAIEVG